MFLRVHPKAIFLLTSLFLVACQREFIVSPDSEIIPEKPSVIPAGIETLPRMYITTPSAIVSKDNWMDGATLRLEVRVAGRDSVVYEGDTQIRGRGNSTWGSYPKKPYALKLDTKANFIGTGKTRHWVLLANWGDRTLLRNQVAFEAARRTSLEWTPSGTFVDLYMNDPDSGEQDVYQGIYWLGEKVRVEGSHFEADYLYSFDSSDRGKEDYSAWCHYYKGGEWQEGEVPVILKYPDKDDYPLYYWISYLKDASLMALQQKEDAIYHLATGEWKRQLDLNSFCDWYLVNELCVNAEGRHPKSCFYYIRDGIMYAGPVWDFDFGTFRKSSEVPRLRLRSSLYYFQLFPLPEFRNHLIARWKYLRPRFVSLVDYVDEQADWIRSREEANHDMWPCYPNPLASPEAGGYVNGDEDLSFQEAVDRMKEAILWRIEVLDEQLAMLQ